MQFLNDFWKKYTRHSFFSNVYFFIFVPFRNQLTPEMIFYQFFCVAKIYIFFNKMSLKLIYDRYSPFSKKVPLKEKFTAQTFSEQSANLKPKPKKNLWQFYLKGEGQRISEHPGLTPWPKNGKKKWFCKLRQCSFTAPKMHFLLYFWT